MEINEKSQDELKNEAHDEDNKTLKNPKRGRVFIRNLPFNINEDKLKELFQIYGEITEVIYNNIDKFT